MSSLSTVIRDSSRRTCATRPLRTTHHTTKADSPHKAGSARSKFGSLIAPQDAAA
ncbi:hypothetical protein HMPREF9573_01451 [Cutibacterium acnes HL072PA2]|nr:hypothetical protein HMPREF9573_01451 [Cutibacterium acnes HL072PA2]EFT55982.1 hypothetical protein HMPREF9610_00993 [Cutibacterium acnes HL027PA2]